MISEEQQDQAALYALGLLTADEAWTVEREMEANEEFRALVTDFHETAAGLVRMDTPGSPPPNLKTRVLTQAERESRAGYPAKGKVIAGPSAWTRSIPWALAAALAIFCGVLGWKYHTLDHEVQMSRYAASFPKPSALQQIVYCSLEAAPKATQSEPGAAVLWDTVQRRGRLRLTKLPPAADGRDYQLWTVEAGVKDPLNAGVVKVGTDGTAEIEFRPVNDDGKAEVVAFALSDERAGGVPKSEGTLLFLGKIQP